VSKFGRSYKSNSEFQNRLSNFAKNLDIVNSHNAKNVGFELELNKFADLSDQEFKSMLGFRSDLIEDDDSAINAEVDEQQTYPTSVDWRTKNGILAPIKNQGSCGSCYSFASMEALQSLYHIKKGAFTNGTVINLSEQQVVDCSAAYGNQGCNGGLMEYVYNYLKAAPIELEQDYVYAGKKNAVCSAVASKGLFKVTGYNKITVNSPTAHIAAL
jgi:C1A family cysteine protease